MTDSQFNEIMSMLRVLETRLKFIESDNEEFRTLLMQKTTVSESTKSVINEPGRNTRVENF